MFELRINGETAWKTERQVIQISTMTSRGEASKVGISQEGVVDIIITEVSPSGPMRLDQVEALERQMNAERMGVGSQGVLTAENYQPQEDANRLVQGPLTYLADPNENPAPGALVGSSADIATEADSVTDEDYSKVDTSESTSDVTLDIPSDEEPTP